jgi:hypothetical protein
MSKKLNLKKELLLKMIMNWNNKNDNQKFRSFNRILLDSIFKR